MWSAVGHTTTSTCGGTRIWFRPSTSLPTDATVPEEMDGGRCRRLLMVIVNSQVSVLSRTGCLAPCLVLVAGQERGASHRGGCRQQRATWLEGGGGEDNFTPLHFQFPPTIIFFPLYTPRERYSPQPGDAEPAIVCCVFCWRGEGGGGVLCVSVPLFVGLEGRLSDSRKSCCAAAVGGEHKPSRIEAKNLCERPMVAHA